MTDVDREFAEQMLSFSGKTTEEERIARMQVLFRIRLFLVKAGVRIKLSSKATRKSVKDQDLPPVCAEWVLAPMLEAFDPLSAKITELEDRLREDARALRIWDWIKEVNGASENTIFTIVGEAGDLCRFPSPASLWKWMGLAVIQGEAQRHVRKGEDPEEWTYCPRRRSAMHMIGRGLSLHSPYYRSVFLDRKRYEINRVLDNGGETLTTNKATRQSWIDAGFPVPKKVTKSYKKKKDDMSCGVVHRRATRYMEKRFLVHFWAAWIALAEGKELPPSAQAVLDAQDPTEVLKDA